jgi:hypothetical protein
VLNEAGGRIAYRFHARDLNLVMSPGARAWNLSVDTPAATNRGSGL